MKTYYTNDFTGHWPVGAAAVVLAEDEADARRKFLALFEKHGLPQYDDTWTVHELTEGPAVMLVDGDY
jgi:hypothetical protein